MDRQAQRLAFQVPQGDVARGEGVDVEAGRMPPFPHAVEELLPQELHVEGVCADQYGTAQVLHNGPRRIGQYGTLPFAVADQALFGRYAHHQGLVHVGLEGMPGLRDEIRGGRTGFGGFAVRSLSGRSRAARSLVFTQFLAGFSRNAYRECFDVRYSHDLNPPVARRPAPSSPAWVRSGPPPPPGRSAPPSLLRYSCTQRGLRRDRRT